MKEFVSFCHSGTIGDVIASLPAIREGVRRAINTTGNKDLKARLYLKKDIPYSLPYENAPAPTKNEYGEAVMLSEAIITLMKPLIEAQPYIESVCGYIDEVVDCDLDLIRTEYVAMGRFPIQRNYFLVYPQLACNLAEPWLEVPETDKNFAKGKIIVGRTERYNNNSIKYEFLKEYEEDILFSGTMREYNLFTMKYGLNVRKLKTVNFLELAQAVNQANLTVSNQSMLFQIAEGLKATRLVELFDLAPDVTPFGANGYDFLSQKALEYYVKTLGGCKQKTSESSEV